MFFLKNDAWRKANVRVAHPYGMAATHDGRLITCASTGASGHAFFQWNGEDFVAASASFPSPASGYFEEVRESPDGALWAVGLGCLVRWDRAGGKWAEFSGPQNPRFVDARGRVWFVKAGSAVCMKQGSLDPVPFPYSQAHIDPRGNVWGFSADAIGAWIGGQEQHLNAADVGLRRLERLDFDKQGQAWVFGTLYGGGMAASVWAGDQWRIRKLPVSADADVVYSSADPANGVWCLVGKDSVRRFELFHLTDGLVRSEPVEPVLPQVYGGSVLVDSASDVWLWGSSGLFQLDRTTRTWSSVKASLGRYVWAGWETNRDLWFASNNLTGGTNGLVRRRGSEWKAFPTDFTNSWTPQPREGLVFLGGVGRFYILSDQIGNEPLAVDFPGEERVSGIVKDPDGNTWVGLSQTLLRYRPNQHGPETEASAPVQEVRQGTSLGIRFRGVERFLPESTLKNFRFSWRLDSGAWNGFQVEDRTEVQTGALSPGRHVVEVTAQDEALRRDDSPARLEFLVTAIPLQERWWFGPAVASLFLAMTGLAATAAVARRKLAGYVSNLKEKVFERTAELTKANILLEGRGMELVAELSERKSAEEALRVSEQRYRDLVENANDIIYTHDLAGNFTSLNRRGEQITGYSREEALRLNLSQIVSAEQLAIARKMTETKILGGPEVTSTYALEILAKGGRRVMLEVSSRLLYDQGKPVAVEGIGRDITDRKMLEEELRQAQKIEAIGRLAGGVAHDFNNILTAILGHSELLLATPTLERSVREDIEEIKKAGDRAASLTQQLLAFSRKQILEPKVLDLNGVVIGMEKLLLRLIGENVRLGTHIAPQLGKIKADRGQLEQVILNLAINARDAMPSGGFLTIGTANVDLDASTATGHTSATPGRYVMLAVSDTGYGMDVETKARIFEPFFTTKEMGKGTGLGLSTVYGIVKQSDGYIWVYSERDHGTTFKIYLPRVDAVAEQEPLEVKADLPKSGNETILVVEDEASVRNLVTTVLNRQGYVILEAPEGRQALEVMQGHDGPIHLLLTDTVMPEMGGSELAAQFATLRPDTKVLFMSGYTDDAVIRHGVLSEGTSFLQKPFTPDVLVRKVRQVLEG